MNNLKNIREKFGLSQQQVAHWLGISRSLVQFYETGARSLPTHALLQLAKLEMMVVEFEGKGNVVLGMGTDHGGSGSGSGSWGTNHGESGSGLGGTNRGEKGRNHGERGTNHGNGENGGDTKDLHSVKDATRPLHPKLAFQLDKTKRLQQQLSIIQSRHAALQQQMLLIKKMIDNSNEQTSEKEKLWLQMLYHGLCSKLTKFDEAKQVPLKAKILEMRLKQEFMDKKVG